MSQVGASLPLLIAGLPASGKTTFIAALWHRVNDPASHSRLRLKSLGDGDRSYLNQIADAWNRHEAVARTPRNINHRVRMHLSDGDGSEARLIDLEVPDLSGESFEEHLEDRKWPVEYASRVDECRGLMLFVHPDTVVQPHRISEADEILVAMQSGEVGGGNDVEQHEAPERRLPTDVALVDLLQFHDLRNPSLPVAVVISAWDVLEANVDSPGEWLEDRLPLLHQYLNAGITDRSFAVFGVSAQGGDYETDRERLVELEPTERTKVLAPDEEGHDVSLLISWLADKS